MGRSQGWDTHPRRCGHRRGPASLWDTVWAAGRPELVKGKETATLSQYLFRLDSEFTQTLWRLNALV